MKRILTIVILLLAFIKSQAQGIGSFFDQGDTKTKTMLQQIALQETYLAEIKKGYQTTENGLNTANELKTGTFNLHQGYINSLSAVSPAVLNNPKVKLIVTYQQQLMSSFDNELAWQKQQAILGADEISYIEAVYSNMITACTKDLDELTMVTTPGQAKMKDAERINRVETLYTATISKYQFSVGFTQNARAFALDRQSSTQQYGVIKKLYNIN